MCRVFLYSIYMILICISFINSQDEKEVTLNQLFGIKEDSSYSPKARKRKPSVVDIRSLTEEKLQKNFKALEDEFKDDGDETAVKEFIKDHTANNTRRYWLPYKPLEANLYYKNQRWERAQKYNNYAKCADNQLTLIYMARYKMKEVELHPLYNNKTPAYKIAFLYVKLRNIRRRIRSQWTRMERAYGYVFSENEKKDWWFEKYGGRWYDTNVMMANHERCVALHTQFVYYWWVLVRLHEATCNASHIYMTKPTTPSTAATTTAAP